MGWRLVWWWRVVCCRGEQIFPKSALPFACSTRIRREGSRGKAHARPNLSAVGDLPRNTASSSVFPRDLYPLVPDTTSENTILDLIHFRKTS